MTKDSKWLKLTSKEQLLELKEKDGFQFSVTNLSKYLGIPTQRIGDVANFYGVHIPRLSTNVKLTTEEFKRRGLEKHNNFYDYSLSEYVNSKTKVKIICPKHGIFEQQAHVHIGRGDRCFKCKLEAQGDKNRTTKESFINKSNKIHNFKFDYSFIQDYKTLAEKLAIVCPKHGLYYQNGYSHLKGADCEKCSYEKRGVDYSVSEKEMLSQFKGFGNNLTYDLSGYKNTNSIIKYTCPIHGELSQKASTHLKTKDCHKCKKLIAWNTSNTEEFIVKATQVHKGRYDYSNVIYKKNSQNVEIICKHHGAFLQRPNTHLDSKAGCPTCAIITSNFKDYLDDIEVTKDINCDLYLLKLSSEDEVFYKIGISRFTNKRVAAIFGDSGKYYKPILIKSIGTNLFEAATLEQKLHKKYKKFRHFPKVKFAGHTECFTTDLPVQEIIDAITL